MFHLKYTVIGGKCFEVKIVVLSINTDINTQNHCVILT